MELKILDKKQNDLLNRIEVDFELSHPNEQTPKREVVRDMISKELKAPKETVILDSMRTEFGKGTTKGYAKVYTSKEKAVETERGHILKRNKLFEEKKKEEKKDTEKKGKGE